MGIVYLAVSEGPAGFAKLKVIKRLRTDLSSEPEAVRMFQQEARISSRLQHPNVVQTNEVGFDGKHHFLEMEYLEGVPLSSLVRRAERGGKGLALPIAVYVLAQTLAGLHYAHELKDLDGTDLALVHRDVSPHNVFVTYEGEVKLLDFGIARAAGASNETKTGFLKGKVTYMAPEQVAKKSLDRRVDVFAVGVMLWESLTGQRLWGDLDDFQIFLKLRSEDIPSPRTVRADVPEALEAACMRALAPDPEARFATAADMQRELEAWLASSGERAGAKELAETMLGLFAEDRAATKAEIEEQMRAAPATTGTTGLVPAMQSSVDADSTPGVGGPQTTAATAAMDRPKRGSAMVAGTALAMALVVGGAVGVNRWRAAKAKPGPVATAAPKVEPGMSSNAEAMEAYRAGMQAFRDADVGGAIRSLDKAIELDKAFPAAHLRRAIATSALDDSARSHLRDALAQRTRLGEHDRVLLDAYAPRATVPEDLAETEKRLTSALAAAPNDADFALQLCRAQNYRVTDAARDTCDRASALDPDSARPIREVALARVQQNDEASAKTEYERCLRVSPLATTCSFELTRLEAYQGQCAAALANVRRVISTNRAGEWEYRILASLLLATGEPADTVRAAQDLERDHAAKEAVPLLKIQGATDLAMFTGDFPEAERQLRLWSDAVASSEDEGDRFMAIVPRVMILEEEGRTAEAVSILKDTLRRVATWTATDPAVSMFLFGRLHRMGAMDRSAFVARRAQWLEASRAERGAGSQGVAWTEAYAMSAVDATDAREALDALPSYQPLPDPLHQIAEFELAIGRVYRLAGNTREALPYLRQASSSCIVLESPMEILTASLELGLADEELGDVPGACAAYGTVVSRWGTARSTTAKRAQERIRALRCK
jgi:serine/threonine-protein kinase